MNGWSTLRDMIRMSPLPGKDLLLKLVDLIEVTTDEHIREATVAVLQAKLEAAAASIGWEVQL